jgi:4-phospho-D-threonate 3-dehydrogenase / 4-phospho-D-erythronate 3-dehydrogenase
MGDPAGIGPEIVCKALSSKEIYETCAPLVIGDAKVLSAIQEVAHTNLEIRRITKVSEAAFALGIVDVIDLSNVKLGDLRMGEAQAMGGKASFEYVKAAVEMALNKEVDAIATAPITKETLVLAGLHYPGHTEILAELTHSENYGMMFFADQLRVILVTIHVPLAQAIKMITKSRVLSTINLADKSLKRFGFGVPRIAVAGLNPHAGESGIFGSEEIEEISPAVRDATKMGLKVYGPFPSDTVFHRAKEGEFDVVVALYHDQGCIPVKLLSFWTAVNVTVGLPIIRTSPDHGTAYDIARSKSGAANPNSLIESIKLAAKLSRA